MADKADFSKTASGRSFLRIYGDRVELLIDVADIAGINGEFSTPEPRTSIRLTSGSSEVVDVEPKKLVKGMLEFLDAA